MVNTRVLTNGVGGFAGVTINSTLVNVCASIEGSTGNESNTIGGWRKGRVTGLTQDSSYVRRTVGARNSVFLFTTEPIKLTLIDNSATREGSTSDQGNGSGSRSDGKVARKTSDCSLVNAIGTRLNVVGVTGITEKSTFIDI